MRTDTVAPAAVNDGYVPRNFGFVRPVEVDRRFRRVYVSHIRSKMVRNLTFLGQHLACAIADLRVRFLSISFDLRHCPFRGVAFVICSWNVSEKSLYGRSHHDALEIFPGKYFRLVRAIVKHAVMKYPCASALSKRLVVPPMAGPISSRGSLISNVIGDATCITPATSRMVSS